MTGAHGAPPNGLRIAMMLESDGPGGAEMMVFRLSEELRRLGHTIVPVGPRFDVVGRWNFSLPEEETLERFLGFEYQSCCWAMRVVTRRYVSTRSGDTESAIFLQLELKGLTSLGSPADDLLEHGILGYSR